MPIIRASEIGSYICRRAWHYRKKGMESENQPTCRWDWASPAWTQDPIRASPANLGMICFWRQFSLVAYCTAQL
jgi:hypothetical protein